MRIRDNHHPTGRPGNSPKTHRLLVASGVPQIPREEQPAAVMARRFEELSITPLEGKVRQAKKYGYRRPQGALTSPGWILGDGDRTVTCSKPLAFRPNPLSHEQEVSPAGTLNSGGRVTPTPSHARSGNARWTTRPPSTPLNKGRDLRLDQGLWFGPLRLARQAEGAQPEPAGETEEVIDESSGVLTYRSGRRKTAVLQSGPCVQGVAAPVARSIQEPGSGPDHIDGGAGHTISNRRPLRAGVLVIEAADG